MGQIIISIAMTTLMFPGQPAAQQPLLGPAERSVRKTTLTLLI